MTDGPLIVQSDKTLLLEIGHPDAAAARANIAPFAELERSPEHIHTYRITPLALWNARAAGHDAEQVVDALVRWSRFPVPQALLVDVVDTMGRYGRLVLQTHPAHGLIMVSRDRAVLEEILRHKKIAPMLGARIDPDTVIVHPSQRGHLKQALLKVGWPADDEAGYVDGEAHHIELDLAKWHLRSYQQEAVEGFWAGGSGVVVLPCGAGKTLVGAAAMAKAGATTLILVTNTVAGRQWRRELLARTSLTEEEIGEYSGERKEIRPVTIATYQVMTRKSGGVYKHLDLFDSRDWGLVIYDEVHLLPAPVFRMTADLQSRRRLGLTATLVREDGREGDVFSLIGPEAVRRAVEGHRVAGLDRAGRVHRGAGDADRRRAAVVRHRRARGAVQDRLHRADQDAGGPVDPGPASRRADAGHRRLPGAAGGTRRGTAGADHPGLHPQRRTGAAVSTPSGAARCPCWWCPRWRTSPSTCRTPPSPSRCPARSGPGRRRRSGWAGSCGPRTTGGRRTSTRSSPGTPWTPTTRRTGSGSWPSRVTPTGSSTPTTCSGRRCRGRRSRFPLLQEFVADGQAAAELPAGLRCGTAEKLVGVEGRSAEALEVPLMSAQRCHPAIDGACDVDGMRWSGGHTDRGVPDLPRLQALVQ